MSFEQPGENKEEYKDAELELTFSSWWLGKKVHLKVKGPAKNILEFTKDHVPVGKVEKEEK